MTKEKVMTFIGAILLIAGIIYSGALFFLPKKGYTLTGAPYIKEEYLNTFKGQTKLAIITPDNDREAFHPKIVFFEKPWHGYKYWLSFNRYY